MTTLLAWLAAFLLVLALFGVLGEKLQQAPLGLRVLVISGVLVLVMANVVMPFSAGRSLACSQSG